MKYRKPIATYCRLYHKWVGMEVADLEAEMYEVLHKCVLKYDPDNGASFNTFIWQGIYNRFRSILRYQNAGKRAGHEIPFSPVESELEPGGRPNPNYDSLDRKLFENGFFEADTEEVFLALDKVSEMVYDPRMQTRMRSARQFSHA